MQPAKLLVIALWIFFIGVASTITGVPKTVSDENGKDLYKVDCKICHAKDSPNGEYTPMSLTQDQWRTFFDKKFAKSHQDVIMESAKKKLLEYLTPEQVSKIKKFCVDHAADSEQPQTCSD